VLTDQRVQLSFDNYVNAIKKPPCYHHWSLVASRDAMLMFACVDITRFVTDGGRSLPTLQRNRVAAAKFGRVPRTTIAIYF